MPQVIFEVTFVHPLAVLELAIPAFLIILEDSLEHFPIRSLQYALSVFQPVGEHALVQIPIAEIVLTHPIGPVLGELTDISVAIGIAFCAIPILH